MVGLNDIFLRVILVQSDHPDNVALLGILPHKAWVQSTKLKFLGLTHPRLHSQHASLEIKQIKIAN